MQPSTTTYVLVCTRPTCQYVAAGAHVVATGYDHARSRSRAVRSCALVPTRATNAALFAGVGRSTTHQDTPRTLTMSLTHGLVSRARSSSAPRLAAAACAQIRSRRTTSSNSPARSPHTFTKHVGVLSRSFAPRARADPGRLRTRRTLQRRPDIRSRCRHPSTDQAPTPALSPSVRGYLLFFLQPPRPSHSRERARSRLSLGFALLPPPAALSRQPPPHPPPTSSQTVRGYPLIVSQPPRTSHGRERARTRSSL